MEINTVGSRLRAARRSIGESQVWLSRETGLSVSFIRKVEAGNSDISLNRLLSWLQVLGISISDLFGETASEVISVCRADQRIDVANADEGVKFSLLGTSRSQLMEPGIFTLGPAAKMRTPLRHSGEEALYVLSGRILLTVDSASVSLEEGDSAYYRSDYDHFFQNGSAQEQAEILVTASYSGGLQHH